MSRRKKGLAMKPFTRALLWILLTMAFVIVADQVLIRLPDQPAGAKTIEDVLQEQARQQRPAAPPKAGPTPVVREPVQPAQRYLYVDGSGELQFAESLDEVPSAFRKDAKPMAP
jgi:hypothetical protein